MEDLVVTSNWRTIPQKVRTIPHYCNLKLLEDLVYIYIYICIHYILHTYIYIYLFILVYTCIMYSFSLKLLKNLGKRPARRALRTSTSFGRWWASARARWASPRGPSTSSATSSAPSAKRGPGRTMMQSGKGGEGGKGRRGRILFFPRAVRFHLFCVSFWLGVWGSVFLVLPL